MKNLLTIIYEELGVVMLLLSITLFPLTIITGACTLMQLYIGGRGDNFILICANLPNVPRLRARSMARILGRRLT